MSPFSASFGKPYPAPRTMLEGQTGMLSRYLQNVLQLVKMFYDKEKMDKNIEKTTIKIQ